MKTSRHPLASTASRYKARFDAMNHLREQLKKSAILGFGAYLGLAISLPAFAQLADKPLFLTGQGLPPNILLILDNSDSMQEGLSQGRVGFNWDNTACVPGPNVNAETCPSGTLYENSKGAIVKRVARNLTNNYRGQINLGLMSYQQHPASDTRNDAFESGTVRWRLMHRIADARFANVADPDFYQPDHNEPLDSGIKRFREPHPKLSNTWIFYNVAVPGYWRDGANWESRDRTFFCSVNATNNNPNRYACYDDMTVGSGDNPDIEFENFINNFNITITDSMRQRGVTSWGQYVVFSQLNQNEWRANNSPGPGYLHVPIGGTNPDGTTDNEHWESILTKLGPQRVDYSETAMTDPNWPIIAAGLTPLEGTMRTARDYFTGNTTSFFGSSQGNNGNLSLPESCNVNAALWLTDGLPSVDADGNPLGTAPQTAVRQARDAIADFYSTTEDALGEGVQTYIVGFALPPGVDNLFDTTEFPTGPLDVLAEAGGTERAYSAQNEAELEDVISGLFSRIVRESAGSAAAVAANSTSLQSGTAIFQAGFDSRDWSGELKALRVESPQNPGDSVVQNTPAWNAEERLPAHGTRNIITWVPSSGNRGQTPLAAFGETKPFRYDDLNNAQRQALGTPAISGITDLGRKRVNWLRGSQAEEGFNATNLRTRSRLLGDIVYSRPLFIQAQNFGYQAFSEGGNSYPAALNSWANPTNNPPLVAVAANDGKLHFFDARLPCRTGETTESNGCSATGGTEVFAYVPNLVIPQLSKLTSQNYNRDREYIFDGSPRLGHVYDGTKWRRIVVGSLGRGGKGAFALDVDTQEVLWEVSPTTHPEIGNVIGEPILGRAASGQWITVIPNGYGSSDGKASLIILDTLTGGTLEIFEPNNATVNPANGNNGMFTPIAVDLNGDRKIDRLYAGDLRGNMWRYDLGGNSGTNQWGVPNFLSQGQTQSPLFQARTSGGQIQPITARPAVVSDDRGRVVVLFGTGKYFEPEDNNVSTARTQSFYGIIDNGQSVTRNQLRTQEITHEVSEFGFELRATTERDITDTQRGWVLDLISPNNGFEGERVIEDAIIRPGNRVVFSTLIPQPSSDPCQPGGGTGWIMELDAFTGSRLENSPFDLSGQGFGEESFISVVIDGETVRIPPSGIRSTVGIPTRPAVIEDPQQRGREYKLPVGSQGQVMEIIEERVGSGRRSWRQLR